MAYTTYLLYAVILIVFLVRRHQQAKKQFIDLPAVGPTGLGSWVTAWRYLWDAKSVIQEGYEKYEAFKVPLLNRWAVIITSRRLVEELRSAPDESFNFLAAVDTRLCFDYTIGPQIHSNPYHADVVRLTLTRNIRALFDEMYEEVEHVFKQHIQPQGNEWLPVSALHVAQVVVCQSVNRLFVGLPLCREPDYVDLMVGFTREVALCGDLISQFPHFMMPFVAWCTGVKSRSLKRTLKHVGAMVDQRIKMYKEQGKDWEKPNDMLTWLMDEATDDEMTRENLALRILFLNFASIHTSANVFTQALFHLASMPHFLQPMREEVESIVAEYGWSKDSLGRMRKVDSFLREASRYNGINVISVERLSLTDFTFSDGTFIPKGTLISAASRSIHFDNKNHKDAETFDGFRWSDIRDSNDEEGVKNHMVTTSPDYLIFGHGRHACPGRFFAANELKLMLAYLVVNYDVKMPGDGSRPADSYYSAAVIPDMKAKVLFRKRQN